VKAGTGILVPPFTAHHLVNESSSPLRVFYMGFTGNFFPQLQQNGFEAVLSANEKLQASFYKKSLYETLTRITSQVDLSDEDTLNVFRPLLLANIMGFYIESFCTEAASYRNAADMKLLKNVKTTIVNNIDRNVTVEEMAKVLGMSQRQFATRFTKLTGMSFKEYENMIKMEEASQMLYTTDKSISQISDELGFCDIHYFSRKFKEYYGCAPTMLRKKKGVVNG
jgi:AraC-like DNA-binding protein